MKARRNIVRTAATISILCVVAVFAILSYRFLSDESSVRPQDSTEQSQQSGPYLEEEEAVIVETETHEERVLPVESVLFEYVEVKDSCDVHFEGECVLVRSGPGISFPVVTRVRNNVVLKVSGQVFYEERNWYKIVFDEELRYPERVTTDWYIASEYADVLYDEGTKDLSEDISSTTKMIIVDISEQKLYAYEHDMLFMELSISTGREISPTPKGTFTIFRKTPSRFMQGPLPGQTDVYDLPGVPWNLYFTHEGAVIHGTYWHRSFGKQYSHGCVNLPPKEARDLYYWADLGTKVTVRN